MQILTGGACFPLSLLLELKKLLSTSNVHVNLLLFLVNNYRKDFIKMLYGYRY